MHRSRLLLTLLLPLAILTGCREETLSHDSSLRIEFSCSKLSFDTVVTTIGFGDLVAQHFLSRVLSVLLSISAAVVIALVTGVILNYFIQMHELKNQETVSAFLDKLEHLPELPPEELEQLSRKVKEFRDKT